jgi:hypothetical protein
MELVFTCSIESPIRAIIRPPAISKDAISVPKAFRNRSSVAQHATIVAIINVAISAPKAECRFSSRV